MKINKLKLDIVTNGRFEVTSYPNKEVLLKKINEIIEVINIISELRSSK